MTPNFVNRTIWTGDNLDVMRGMNSDSVDLIYLDSPAVSMAWGILPEPFIEWIKPLPCRLLLPAPDSEASPSTTRAPGRF